MFSVSLSLYTTTIQTVTSCRPLSYLLNLSATGLIQFNRPILSCVWHYANLYCFAAYSSPPLTSLPVATNDVTREYDPNLRRTVEYYAQHHFQPSPPASAGFSHPSVGHNGSQRVTVPDRCPSGPPRGPWLDDYWAYSSMPCDATVTSSCEARRRYHVTTPSPVDVTELVVKDERLTSVPSGMVAYAG